MFTEPGLHLVAAHRGVGSTITLLNILRARAKGETVLGSHQAPPAQVAYIDPKGPASLSAIMFVKGGDDDLAVMHTTRRADEEPFGQTMTAVAQSLRRAQDGEGSPRMPPVVGIDPAIMITDSCSANNTAEIGRALLNLESIANKFGICFVLSHFLSKQYQRDSPIYSRVAGCSLWTSKTLSKTIIEPQSIDPLSRTRTVLHYPQYGAPYGWDCRIREDGVLVSEEQSDIDMFFAALGPDDQVTTAEIVEIFEMDGQSRSTAMRWLKRAMVHNRVVKVEHGIYAKA